MFGEDAGRLDAREMLELAAATAKSLLSDDSEFIDDAAAHTSLFTDGGWGSCGIQPDEPPLPPNECGVANITTQLQSCNLPPSTSQPQWPHPKRARHQQWDCDTSYSGPWADWGSDWGSDWCSDRGSDWGSARRPHQWKKWDRSDWRSDWAPATPSSDFGPPYNHGKRESEFAKSGKATSAFAKREKAMYQNKMSREAAKKEAAKEALSVIDEEME